MFHWLFVSMQSVTRVLMKMFILTDGAASAGVKIVTLMLDGANAGK